MRKYDHVLFDLDGTLTDPASGITRSVQYSLKKFGIDSKLEELKKFIGPPLYDSYVEYYGFTREQAVEAVAYYRELYKDGGAMYDCRVCDGIPELLERLKSEGVDLIVATSKPLVMAEKILEKFELAKYFNYVFGCELDGRRTRKEEVIEYALENHPIELSRSIMVGDRLHDINGAHLNNLPAVGVLWGYGSREEFDENHADFVASNTNELMKFLIE